MKKIVVVLVCIVVVMALGACANKGFEFRGNYIGDSVEEVIEKEGKEPDFIREREEISTIVIIYDNINFLKSDAKIRYVFLDGKLYLIEVLSRQDKSLDVNEFFDELLQELELDYGAPEYKVIDDFLREYMKAWWYKEDYSMEIYATEDEYRLIIAPRTD